MQTIEKIEQAKQLIQQNKLKEAEEILSKIDDKYAIFEIAKIKLIQGNDNEAEKLYRRVLSLDDTIYDAVLDLARIYVRQSRYDLAVQFYDKYIETTNDNNVSVMDEKYESLIEYLKHTKDKIDVDSLNEKIKSWYPDRKRIYLELANYCVRNDKTDKAIENLRQYKKNNGVKIEVLLLLAKLYFKINSLDYSKALINELLTDKYKKTSEENKEIVKVYNEFFNRKDKNNITKNYISIAENIKSVEMRKFPKFEMPIFAFGYGQNLSFDERSILIDYCMKHGIKYYETAWIYENSEVSVGKILKKYPRNSFYLADKIPPCSFVGQTSKIFEEQLSRCQVEYFDFFLIHGISGAHDLLTRDKEIYPVLAKEKRNGRIKNLGFSYHGNAKDLEVLIQNFEWDFVQLSLNAIDWQLNRARELYNIVTRHNLPIITMNSLKGGQANLNEEAANILKKANPEASVASWSYRFLASYKNIVLLSRADTVEQMAENIVTFSKIKPLSEEEREILFKAIDVYISKGVISCVYCNYCKKCPMNIEISKYFYMYNQYKVAKRNKDRNFIIEYEAIPEDRSLNRCVNCGFCKTKCTQHLDIPNILKKIGEEYKNVKKILVEREGDFYAK